MLVAVASVAVSVKPATATPPPIAQKQSEANAIISEIDRLDSDLNRAVEAYNGARLHLAQAQNAIAENTRILGTARLNLRAARAKIASRLVALYTNGHPASALEIILNARTLSDVLAGLDAASRIDEADSTIAHQAQRFRSIVIHRRDALLRDRASAERLAQRAKTLERAIQASLNERQRLLGSVRGEMARMEAAERKRQLLLAAQARARLAAVAQRRQVAEARRTPPVSPTSRVAELLQSPTPSASASIDAGTSSPPATIFTAAPAPSAEGSAAVSVAMQYLGVPYVWGGSSPDTGFDCSGFTMYVYAQVGVSLPHYTGDQWLMGQPVSRDQLAPGDLVFFDGLGHEGIYIGNNEFIHAPHTGDVVKISSISGGYESSYVGARRV